jgi:hypothetical protein
LTPAAHIFAPQMYFSDPGNKNKRLLIQNIVGYEPKETDRGDRIDKPIIEYFRFGSTGSMILKMGEEDQIYFGRVHNKNSTNPHRDKKAPAIFYEVDEKKEISLAGNILVYKRMALNMVSDADDEMLLDFAKKISRSGRYKFDLEDIDKLKLQLEQTADSKSIDFLAGVREEKSYARLVVDHLEASKHILFDSHPGQLAWKFRFRPGNKSDVIFKVTAEKVAKKELLEYLLSADGKGNKSYMELKELFEEHYQLK